MRTDARPAINQWDAGHSAVGLCHAQFQGPCALQTLSDSACSTITVGLQGGTGLTGTHNIVRCSCTLQ